ncbi:hypothetical protein ST47_g9571 [Ascochyta rabiei]|uniref:Uncharacterized protein n=1 Tax=Didymella rabiei TaxID=5454 RepID=A0A162WZH3_DIDRA|nr:hypothetical protein ST47_g9571 [Ascochyta rabiei]
MFDQSGFYQREYPNCDTTQSTNVPPAPPPSPASYSKTNDIASAYGLDRVAKTSQATARCKGQQNSLEPTPQPPCELAKNWTQADHNLLYVIHYSVHDTWRAAIEQLAEIDIQTNVSRNPSTQKLSEQLDTLNRAYGFKQMPCHSEEIFRDENMVLENMMVYVEILQASDTARDQRARIDSALYSPTVLSLDLVSCDELHRLMQHNLPCEFPRQLSPL